MKIGFFDSGLGGLLLLKSVAKELPQYDYEFYGDTAHLPYGDRSEEEIQSLTRIGVKHLFDKDCALVIIACNTASAETLRTLQESMLVDEYSDRRILGVIIPTVETVVANGSKSVGLLATKRTIESGKYDRELSKLDAEVKLTSKSLPTLVPLIESGKNSEAAELICEETKLLKESGIQVIILGCTHYCLLKEDVREVMGGEGVVISQDEIIPVKLKDYLWRHVEIESKLSRDSTRNIYLTAHKSEYDEILRHLMGGVLISD